MIVRIKKLLSQQELTHIRQVLERAEYKDGRTTASRLAGAHKNNLEFSAAGTPQQKLDQALIGRLYGHPKCQALLPHKIAHPYYVRYETGMAYGDHNDDPVMGGDDRYRSDMAVTIFLNDQSDYQGGDLLINTQSPDAVHTIRGDAGDAVIYPATSMHRVEVIRGGVRLVAVSWIQSLIRDAAKRELVYHLGELRSSVMRHPQADSSAAQKADWLYANLVRRWSDL